MGRDKKITLSLFLTWVVFGLFNLFGQPQAFVPPIIVDGLLVAGLGVYFSFPFRKNFFYPGIILFTIFILILSAAELNWFYFSHEIKAIVIFICFLFCLTFFAGSFLYYGLSKLFFLLSMIVAMSFTFSFLLAFLPNIKMVIQPIYVYMIGGIFSFIIVLMNKDEHPASITLNRIMLLILLNFLYDIGNYLALLQFTAN